MDNFSLLLFYTLSMKTLKLRFDNIKEKNPFWGDYICFAETVRGQNFKESTIARWFSLLVPKDDYEQSDKKQLLKCLGKL